MEQKDSRPFNYEHARAGAPIACRNGDRVEIFKWDGKQAGRPIMGAVGPWDYPVTWGEDGSFENRSGAHERDLVMTPLGYIDGKPLFVGDEVIDKQDGGIVKAGPLWSDMNPNLWSWPAPAKQYPESAAPLDVLAVAYWGPQNDNKPESFARSMRAVANAALRHAVDSGYLVLPGVAMKDDDIIKALRQAQRKHDSVLINDVVVLDAVRSLLVTDPEIDQLRADLEKERRHLIVAENLLEHLGWRWNGVDRKWLPPAPALVGQDDDPAETAYWEFDARKKGLGQWKGIPQSERDAFKAEYREAASRGAARDMAIAEAVRDACFDAVAKADVGFRTTAIRGVHLISIISKVQP